MNITEHELEELDLDKFQVNEILRCLLHTIIFVRYPSGEAVRPKEVGAREAAVSDPRLLTSFCCSVPQQECELFGISYVKSGFDEVDKKVEEAIANFHSSLVPKGPELWKGKVEVRFFERRKKQNGLLGVFGFKNNDDKCSWEHWVVPVLMNATPRAVGNDSASGPYVSFLPFHAAACAY